MSCEGAPEREKGHREDEKALRLYRSIDKSTEVNGSISAVLRKEERELKQGNRDWLQTISRSKVAFSEGCMQTKLAN